MKVSKRTVYIGIAIAAAIWSIVGGKVFAASLFQTIDIGTGENTFNRGTACSVTTVYCYLFGGGADSGNVTASAIRYNRDTNTTSSITSLPNADLFVSYANGAYEDRIVVFSDGGLLSHNLVYIYNETANSYQTASEPSSLTGSMTGTSLGRYFYMIGPCTGGTSNACAARLDILNPGGGWTLLGSSLGVGISGVGTNVARAVADPVNGFVLIFDNTDGELYLFDINTNAFELLTGTFPPCDGITVCQPSLAFYDADLGIVAGKQGDISSTTIGLYQLQSTEGSWEFSTSPVETLTSADFNTSPFNNNNWTQPMNAASTNSADGITLTFFGGSPTFVASPGYTAENYWIRTGDPGGITPTERNFDTWIENFLASMGMDSPVGKLLVGSFFVGILFFVLAVRGVPWLMSLGLAGVALATVTAATIFDPVVMLGLFAIVMMGGIFLVLSMLVSRGD